MKFTAAILTTFIAFTSATRLCDKLITVRTDLSSLSTTISNNITTRAQLNSAYMSLTGAQTILNSLNTEITQTTGAIDAASQQLSNLDISTGCWLGWLENLESGLQVVSADLQYIYNIGASDFSNGNFRNVQNNAATIASQVKSALAKLTSAQFALNNGNANVLCWSS